MNAAQDALITYTEAIILTGLSYQQLRRGVKDNHIPATPSRPFHPVKLLKLAVLEFAEAKDYRGLSRAVLNDPSERSTKDLPPDFWASEPEPLPDFDPQARREPTFTVLPEPERSAKLHRRSHPSELSLRVLQEADRLHIRLRGELEPLRGAAALLRMLERELHTLWNQWHHLELHADDLRGDDPATYATEHSELERYADELFTRMARISASAQRCDYGEGEDAPF